MSGLDLVSPKPRVVQCRDCVATDLASYNACVDLCSFSITTVNIDEDNEIFQDNRCVYGAGTERVKLKILLKTNCGITIVTFSLNFYRIGCDFVVAQTKSGQVFVI